MFAEMIKSPGSDFIGTPFDGICGMGYPALASSKVTPPFFTMIQQGAVQSPTFAFYLKKQLDGRPGGYMTLGGYDPADFIGNLVWLKVLDPAYWLVSLQSVSVGGRQAAPAAEAILDTGTSLIACPQDVSRRINAMIGGVSVGDGMYAVSCSSMSRLPPIKIKLGGFATFTLRPVDYIIRVGDTCLSGFTGADFTTQNGRPGWILGDVFLRPYFSVYDAGSNRVGLAISKP